MTPGFFLAAAYMIGALPTSYIVGRWHKLDLRKEGSGNLGSTNVYRVVGFKPAVVVLFVDLLKGFFPVWFFPQWDGHAGAWELGYGVAAVLGHIWPLYIRFRGGKGVATAAGTLFALAPVAVTIAFFLWLGTLLLTRTASLGVLIAATTIPIIARGAGASRSIVMYALFLGILVWWTHRTNLARLLHREEIEIYWNRKFTPSTNLGKSGDKEE